MNTVTAPAAVAALDAALTAAPSAAQPTMGSLFGLPDQAPHERITLAADEATGLRTILAIHSTARGPAFGGCRFWSYADESMALTDALRLSQGMSLKNALAGLPFGGGKAVILKPANWSNTPQARAELFAAFGRAVNQLQGAYITAEDVGTTTADMRVVQQHTAHVSGIPRDGAFGGDPSPKTAWGVFVSIQAGAQHHLGRSDLQGLRVAIQGLGAVGWHLAEHLHRAGAALTVADIDPAKLERARAELGATVVGVNEILSADVDVLAPCALGASLNAHSIPLIRAQLIAGAANNQLATVADGDTLHARGVMYLPDYLVNAGGIISVAREHRGEGEETAVMREVSLIGERVVELLQRVKLEGRTPARIADDWARSLLKPTA